MAVLAALLGEVRAQLNKVISEQEDTNKRLAKLESWRSFVYGSIAAVSAGAGWFLSQVSK